MSTKIPITVAHGDGIGPEIMKSVLKILDKAGAPLDIETIEIGEKVYRHGNTSGIDDSAWDSVRRTKVLLKAPITTPLGGGYKSLNVTMRKKLSLFANVRPCVSYYPFIPTRHPKMDMVIVRENEEDLYAGIEHQQTDEVVQCLKLISRPGCEKIVRYAFEYARAYGRRKVSCMTKENIMKQTDGLFRRVFEEIGQEYPDIERDHYIIDIGSARIADSPERFDVIVTLNLYGDIISDIAAQIAGSVGLAGSANIGPTAAMFEAIHGSAPDIAGRGIANPSGLLQGAVQMLVHIGLGEQAELVQNAWLRTLEEGYHTADIFREGVSRQMVGTDAFTDAVIANLGRKPDELRTFTASRSRMKPMAVYQRRPAQKKELVGVDVVFHYRDADPLKLAAAIQACLPEDVFLKTIANRGMKVYPDPSPETFFTDHFQARFMPTAADTMTPESVLQVLNALAKADLDFVKTEHLYRFDGKNAFSLGQGE